MNLIATYTFEELIELALLELKEKGLELAGKYELAGYAGGLKQKVAIPLRFYNQSQGELALPEPDIQARIEEPLQLPEAAQEPEPEVALAVPEPEPEPEPVSALAEWKASLAAEVEQHISSSALAQQASKTEEPAQAQRRSSPRGRPGPAAAAIAELKAKKKAEREAEKAQKEIDRQRTSDNFIKAIKQKVVAPSEVPFPLTSQNGHQSYRPTVIF